MLAPKITRLAGAENASAPSFPGSPADPSEASSNSPAAGPKKGVRTLVILNSKRSIEGGLIFLERRGYQIAVVNRISEAIKNMQNFRPHAILLSWNLKNTDVRKAYRLLTEKFNLLCIVFAEDNSTRTTASLMSSGIPHSLLAPVSGPSIHMRVQALLRAKVMGAHEKRKRENTGFEKVSGSGLPPDIIWERGHDPEGSGDQAWQGRSTVDKDKTYYFKGPKPPHYDPLKKRWAAPDGKEELGSVIVKTQGPGTIHGATQSNPNGEGFNLRESGGNGESLQATQEGLQSKGYAFGANASDAGDGANGFKDPEADGKGLHEAGAAEALAGEDLAGPPLDDENFDWEAALNDVTNKELSELESSLVGAFEDADETEQSPEEDEAANQQDAAHRKGKAVPTYEDGNHSEKQKKQIKLGSDSLLYKVVKSTAGHRFKPPQSTPKKVELVSYIYPVIVRCPRFKGILYMASATDQDYADLFREFIRNISVELNEAGEDGILTLLPVIKTDPLPFATFFHEKGDFIIQTSHGDEGLAFSFFSTASLPKIDEAKEPEVLTVSLENDIVGGEQILFDLYLHLPRNNKFILYMNKGSILTVKSVSKFLGFGIKSVHIRKKEKDLFLSYWARNLLKNNR